MLKRLDNYIRIVEICNYQEHRIQTKNCCTQCKVPDRDIGNRVAYKSPYQQFDDAVHDAYERMCLFPHPGLTNEHEYLPWEEIRKP